MLMLVFPPRVREIHVHGIQTLQRHGNDHRQLRVYLFLMCIEDLVLGQIFVGQSRVFGAYFEAHDLLIGIGLGQTDEKTRAVRADLNVCRRIARDALLERPTYANVPALMLKPRCIEQGESFRFPWFAGQFIGFDF